MEQAEYEKMFRLEEGYWWFKGKRELIKIFFRKFYQSPKRPKIIDLGCGTGIVMQKFQKYADMSGVDFSQQAIDFCRRRGLKNVRMASLMKLPFPKNSFDAAFCLDVLYHKGISDDQKALKEISRILKPGGLLFITDSAMPILWSKHDLASHAARRYSKRELVKKLKTAGFRIKKVSYFNSFLFPLILISRKLGNLLPGKPSTDVRPLPRLVNSLLLGLYRLEIMIVEAAGFPFGVSIFCVAEKL